MYRFVEYIGNGGIKGDEKVKKNFAPNVQSKHMTTQLPLPPPPI